MNDQATTSGATLTSSPSAYERVEKLKSIIVSSAKKLEYWIFPGHCVLCQLPSHRTIDLCCYCENDLHWLNHQCVQCGLPCAPVSRLPNLPVAAETTIFHRHNFSVTDTNLFSGIGNKNLKSPGSDRLYAQLQYAPERGQPEKGSQPTQDPKCPRCQTGKHFTNITQTISPLAYSGCARWLVQKQKHRKGGIEGRVLAELLSEAIHARETQNKPAKEATLPDLLVPVPLHWQKQWRRGHNQSALLAEYLGMRLGVPVHNALVKRRRSTPAQQSLSKAARATNLIRAFSPTNQASSVIQTLPNRRVAIVDDVITTGSTALALAKVLKTAGASEVHLLSPTRAILST